MSFSVELDVRSQEEFDFSDFTDDPQEEPMILSNVERLCSTRFGQQFAQFWRRSCVFFHQQLDKTREVQRHITIAPTGKLIVFISVTLLMAAWSAGSAKRSEVDTSNSRPLWAKTRLEVDLRREKH